MKEQTKAFVCKSHKALEQNERLKLIYFKILQHPHQAVISVLPDSPVGREFAHLARESVQRHRTLAVQKRSTGQMRPLKRKIEETGNTKE